MAVGIALIGAGTFARDEHLPAIEACPLLDLKAIYSRTQTSAEALAKTASKPVDTYFDNPSAADHTLDDLLARQDIQALIIALPIPIQSSFIKAALATNKHILSEKPIAPDVRTAQDLLKQHKESHRTGIWAVASNLRVIDSVHVAAYQIADIGGTVQSFRVKLSGYVDVEDKYYKSGWRQNPSYQGGMLLDGGIHFVSALRHLLAAVGEDITSVEAETRLLQPHLAPLDTLHATIQITAGATGSFDLSYGAQHDQSASGFEIVLVTSNGAVTLTPTQVDYATRSADEPHEGKRANFKADHGVGKEVHAFALSVKLGEEDERLRPEQALMDLRVLEAMLRSGEEGGEMKAV